MWPSAASEPGGPWWACPASPSGPPAQAGGASEPPSRPLLGQRELPVGLAAGVGVGASSVELVSQAARPRPRVDSRGRTRWPARGFAPRESWSPAPSCIETCCAALVFTAALEVGHVIM